MAVEQVEGCPHRPLRVVLADHRGTPDGHDRIPDELLDHAAVPLDDIPRQVEIARQELACLLGVAALGERREAHEVGEQDGDEASLGDRRGLCLVRGWYACRGWSARERLPATAAEPVLGVIGGPTRRTSGKQGRTTVATEAAVSAVLGPAGLADQRLLHPVVAQSVSDARPTGSPARVIAYPTISRLARLASSRLTPWSGNATVTSSSSRVSLEGHTVPSPNAAWRTRSPSR